MHAYAQTNLQLYRQLIEAGYSEKDLKRIFSGHQLAIALFSKLCRANGKPFLSHLVGTASILAAHGAPCELVLAGLLHAAYVQGDFSGVNLSSSSGNRRKFMARIVGDGTEASIARYTQLRWDAESIEALAVWITGLGESDRQWFFMRAANELEELLDFGMLYCPKGMPDQKWLGRICEIATALGHARLAGEIAALAEQSMKFKLPAWMRTDHLRSFSVPAAGLTGPAIRRL